MDGCLSMPPGPGLAAGRSGICSDPLRRWIECRSLQARGLRKSWEEKTYLFPGNGLLSRGTVAGSHAGSPSCLFPPCTLPRGPSLVASLLSLLPLPSQGPAALALAHCHLSMNALSIKDFILKGDTSLRTQTSPQASCSLLCALVNLPLWGTKKAYRLWM